MHDAAAHEEEEAEKIQDVGQAPAAVQEEQVGNPTQLLISISITRRRRWRLSRLTLGWWSCCTTPPGCISCLRIIPTEMTTRPGGLLGASAAAGMALWWLEEGSTNEFHFDQAATSFFQVIPLSSTFFHTV